jgi:hypothetical protein
LGSADPNWPWDILQAAGAIATAVVAWWQIGSLKEQQQGWKTLEACERYESDPVIHKILICLRDARDDKTLAENPRKFRAEISLLLNYLDGLAIGQFQGFYNKNIIRDHMESIIRDHVAEFLEPKFCQKDGTGCQRVPKCCKVD